jgi:hypothetical protein
MLALLTDVLPQLSPALTGGAFPCGGHHRGLWDLAGCGRKRTDFRAAPLALMEASIEGKPPMASSPGQLREMAAECRRLAAAANRDAVREQLLDIADQFERPARDRQLAPLRRAPSG